MTAIQIKNEVIEWLMEHEGRDAEESLSFAQEFIGMLVMSGSMRPTHDPVLLVAACEATLDFFSNLNSDGETYEEIEYPKLLTQLRTAIATFKRGDYET